MSDRSVTHSTFVLERNYDASPAQVFAAFSDPEAKAIWFGPPDEWQGSDWEMDFRVGGREHSKAVDKDGVAHIFESRYQDIVQDERIVYSYDMHLDDKRISVSLATFEFKPEGDGTRLVLTEQGVYLDGYDDVGRREAGTKGMLEAIDKALREHASA